MSDEPVVLHENVDGFTFHDNTLIEALRCKNKVYEFFEAMALCHTVVAEKDELGNISYASGSSDEIALVNAARSFGFRFNEVKSRTYVL